MTNRDGRLRIVAPAASGLSRDEGLGPSPTGGQALVIQVHRGPAYVLVTVTGEIDIATVTSLRERLSVLAVGGGQVVVDLDRVSFIDAAGLGALAGAARQAAGHGGRLHVVCARRQTRQLFRLTGLDRAVPLALTLAEAVEPVTAEPGAGHVKYEGMRSAGFRGTIPGEWPRCPASHHLGPLTLAIHPCKSCSI